MKCLIVDDDPLICDLLEHFCGKVNDIISVTTSTSGFEAINIINSSSFDVIFLDYDLADITGKDILQVINKSTAVIMITSNKDFASESYDYDQIVDFLVKPVDFTRFFRGFQKAQKYTSQNHGNETRLFIKDGNKLVKVELEDVLYFKSEANYISVVTNDRKILTLMALKDLEPKLPGFFQRVHRSFIVNLNKIDSIDNNVIEVKNDHIPVGQTHEKELLKKINLLN